ncbi:MAG: FHA domain-containing protein [Planctomycetota bacterium]
MNPPLLEVTLTAGALAGQRIRVNRSPAGFGRDAANALVIDLPTVSRVHGELRYDGAGWALINHSPNGTTLNRRPVGRKPRPLADGDQIVVGQQPVMTVTLRDAAAGESAAVEQARDVGSTPAPPAAQRLTPRAKLWLGIFGFWAVVFALAFIFLGGEDDRGPTSAGVPVLSDAQIAAAVRAPLPKREASPRLAGQHFEDAETFYQMVNADPKNAFRAMQSYKTALSYALGDDFTDDRDDWGGKPPAELAIAQKRLLELETQLTQDLQRLYKDAHGKLTDRRYQQARLAFERIYRLYNDSSSPIYDNAQRQRDLARRRQNADR